MREWNQELHTNLESNKNELRAGWHRSKRARPTPLRDAYRISRRLVPSLREWSQELRANLESSKNDLKERNINSTTVRLPADGSDPSADRRIQRSPRQGRSVRPPSSQRTPGWRGVTRKPSARRSNQKHVVGCASPLGPVVITDGHLRPR